MKRCFSMTLLLVFSSCKPLGDSGTTAIVSEDGRNATGLLPLRQRFVASSFVSDGAAAIIENAMRLTYGAVECYGRHSADLFNILEDVTRYGVLGLKREGRKLYIPFRSFEDAINNSPDSGMYENTKGLFVAESGDYLTLDTKDCTLVGDATLSTGSFVKLMSDPKVSFGNFQDSCRIDLRCVLST